MSVDLKLAARQVAESDNERHRNAAFRTIVEHTQANLFRYAARMLGGTAEGEDALQTAYVKAFRALRRGGFSGQSKVNTWLYRIVTNCCIDALRRRREVLQSGNKPDGMVDASQAGDGRRDQAARQALRQLDGWLAELPETQRAVLVLKAVEGFSTAQAADILEISEGAVEQRLVRARAALRKRRSESEETTS